MRALLSISWKSLPPPVNGSLYHPWQNITFQEINIGCSQEFLGSLYQTIQSFVWILSDWMRVNKREYIFLQSRVRRKTTKLGGRWSEIAQWLCLLGRIHGHYHEPFGSHIFLTFRCFIACLFLSLFFLILLPLLEIVWMYLSQVDLFVRAKKGFGKSNYGFGPQIQTL